jgi:beta-glucanase (GH16 family)
MTGGAAGRRKLWACLLGGLSACHNAQGAEPSDVRLPSRLKAPPPSASAVSYVPTPGEHLPREVANTELESAESKDYTLAPGSMVAGRAYRLSFAAQLVGQGTASVAVRFREPTRRETFRTFRQRIEPGPARAYAIELTAPAYAALAELAVEVKGCTLLLTSTTLEERPPLAQTEPVKSWADSYVPAGYSLVFNDEFSGTELNRRKWFTRYIYGSETLDRLNDENQRYADNDNHRVAGGVLSLVAKREKLSKPSGINYQSGMIRSDFTLRYGFFEARVKMPSGLGTWAAFWINSDVSETGRLGHPPEIDFFEFVNNGKDDKVNKIHSAATRTPDGVSTRFTYKSRHFVEQHQDYRAPFDFDKAFHTVGVEWTPNDFTLYVDGLKIFTRTVEWRYKDGALAGPAHVLLNLAIGGQWAGRYGIDDAAFPQALAIDWVRVYQKPQP